MKPILRKWAKKNKHAITIGLVAAAVWSYAGIMHFDKPSIFRSENYGKKIEQTGNSWETLQTDDYALEVSYDLRRGAEIALYGGPLDRKNPEIFATQIKSLEEKVQEYEKFKKEFIILKRINLPTFTLDSLTNPAIIAKQDKSRIWNGLNREPNMQNKYLEKYSSMGEQECARLPQIFHLFPKYLGGEFVKALNESEKKPTLLYVHSDPNSKGYPEFNAVVERLFAECSNDFSCLRVPHSVEAYDSLGVHQNTYGMLFLLDKGVRLRLLQGQQLVPEWNGGKKYSAEEMSKEIKKEIETQ
jgi:hypothetical protein